MVCRHCISCYVRLSRKSSGKLLRLTFVRTLSSLLFRAHVCQEFNVAIDSRIFAVRASHAHGVHYVSTSRRLRQSSPVRRPENMSFISQDDTLFPLFYFYGGPVSFSLSLSLSLFLSQSLLLKNKFIRLLFSRCIRACLKQPATLLMGARNFVS